VKKNRLGGFLAYSVLVCINSCHLPSFENASEVMDRTPRSAELLEFEPTLPAQTISGSGLYVTETLDVATGTIFLQTGKTIQDAIASGLMTCRLTSSEMDGGCTTMKVYSTRLSPTLDGDIPTEWACIVDENPITGKISEPRYWAGSGASIEKAKENAIKLCQLEGGVGCNLERCFNGGRDKIR
jgi:hypothetical protein